MDLVLHRRPFLSGHKILLGGLLRLPVKKEQRVLVSELCPVGGRTCGQDRAYTVQCRGLPMTTSRRREWTERRERKDENGTGTQIDPQTEELGNEYMDIK